MPRGVGLLQSLNARFKEFPTYDYFLYADTFENVFLYCIKPNEGLSTISLYSNFYGQMRAKVLMQPTSMTFLTINSNTQICLHV